MSHKRGETADFVPGLMQDWPLTVDRFLDHANRYHGHRRVVSRRDDGTTDSTSYAEIYRAAKRTSGALTALGITKGSVVATLAMNSAEHLTAWYGICGIGAICHTLNPRLFREQLSYIVNHAQDRLIFADGAFAPLLADLLPSCPSVERIIFLSSPSCTVPIPAVLFPELLAAQSDDVVWGDFDERCAAGLCYTSGTTGKPKGVVYSHRSNFIHALVTLQPDAFDISVRDVVLPAVPLYHANAWAVAFSAPAVGAKMVMPGTRLDGRSLYELIEQEAVTIALGVPSVWLSLLEHVEKHDFRFTSLKRVIVGGAANSRRIVGAFAALGVEAIHSWGMTEMSPVGVIGTLTPEIAGLAQDQQMVWRLKQGRPPLSVELEIFDENGTPLPHDGEAMGRLMVRGPAISSAYFRTDASALDANGYFDTGDIATIDSLGFMKITDRAKDMIKSGGEWISSQDVENAALLHPSVALAAAIGAPHPHWGERPILFVQAKPGAAVDGSAIRQFLANHLAKWCIPDEVREIDSMPLGPTGKVDKKLLRARYAA